MTLITSATFIKSAARFKDAPLSELPEYAFIGRSNVGKSSLINYITGVKNLAKTSATPGKTQLINFFLVNNSWILTDLPGIGYARASKTKREKWAISTSEYLLKRKNLLCVFFLIDARHKPLESDAEFMEWLAIKQIPFVIVFTKADKLSKQNLKANILHYKNHMLQTWEELPHVFVTSSTNLSGRDELLAFVQETNLLIKN